MDAPASYYPDPGNEKAATMDGLVRPLSLLCALLWPAGKFADEREERKVH